jgi:hypothetical protein
MLTRFLSLEKFFQPQFHFLMMKVCWIGKFQLIFDDIFCHPATRLLEITV